jgi:hypothetical protein
MEQQKGIIETLKTAATTDVPKLAKKLEGYKYAAKKTIRRFNKLAKAKK